jgi:hypothetical protein
MIDTDEQAEPKAEAASGPAFLRDRLATIEAALDRGDYKPGPWRRLVDELRDSPQAERIALAPDVNRVSSKLHRRQPRRTIGLLGAVLLEALGGILGGVLVAAALKHGSTLLALVGMGLWVMSFEPLLKLSVGTALGVEYEYAYLYGGVEPRFKMKFGSYLTISPLRRAIVQFAGTLGSPLGALVAARLYPALPTAQVITWIAFWLLVLVNVSGVVTELAGVRRLGKLRLPPGSANEMIVELRCWGRTCRARAS